MAWGRAALGLTVMAVLGAALVSGGSEADSVRREYLPRSNRLRTVLDYGRVRKVDVRTLGKPLGPRPNSAWLARARPLGGDAPSWASRLYRRSLLVLHAVVDPSTGAAVAGMRDGWEYVWPRDAATVAIALSTAGYRSEARHVTRFLLGLDLSAAARFHRDGSPVGGRAAQGDATGWVAAAARATGLRGRPSAQPWRDRADYQEGEAGDLLGNALASTAASRREFVRRGVLVRGAGDLGSGIDSVAAWAVRPFPHPALLPAARRTLLRLAADSGRYGIVPSTSWGGGSDPWTAPTAWTAWSLAVLGERCAALRLMAALRRDVTSTGLLPERVDARTGLPTSTTPLAWSHAFAILALRELWPRTASNSRSNR